ncbi:MAG: hypothetical protein IPP58_09640 [Holophagaceae bacterium]|uniref:Cytochrome c domain-containing protein n=1 Tax=Candidatus Geothrix skivensis TaxID=2954439 RepID=A0A9D7XI13_9BACT|nr:hypothetical protein [Candidatus Geothrix skivensis]
MSLRNQPTSERIFSTCVLLALGAILAGGLVFTLRRDRLGAAATPAARPRLLAVLEGVMAPNVSPAETGAFRKWIQGGATRSDFGPVAAIVANNCASCHGSGGEFPRITSFEDLRPLALEEASGGLYAMLGARTLHIVLFPLIFLVAGIGFLRRTRWAGHRLLLGGCALAVLFNAAQWWLRQGRPEALWASWAASAGLSAAFLALTLVVLRELWGPGQD